MISDAPWIREAETKGYPPDMVPDPVCPVCGAKDPDYIYKMDNSVIGCSECIERMDAGDWAVEVYENGILHD